MPDPKVTPQIQKCAEAIFRYTFDYSPDERFTRHWEFERINKIAALIMEHTGAEELPKCYHNLNLMEQITKTLEVGMIELRIAFPDTFKFTELIKILQDAQDKLTVLLSRLGELYGKEE